MPDFPVSTQFGRRIPKQKFYDHLSVTPQLKRVFTEQIRTIYWRNKIAPSTVNVAAGTAVAEVEVFEIQLNQRSLDRSVLQLIDKEIPYHILFLLCYEGDVQAWIGYKEESRGGVFRLGTYYHTSWLPFDSLTLKPEGLDMDAVYENFIRQIAGGRLDAGCIREAVACDERRQKLLKEIAALEKKVWQEKQFNVQVELNGELKRMKKELENQ
jgi:hypothetical protein